MKKQDENVMDATTKISEEPILSDNDFAELLELEKNVIATEEQLDKVSGNIFRLSKEQEALFSHGRKASANVMRKRDEITSTYKLDSRLSWRIDINTKKIIYPR